MLGFVIGIVGLIVAFGYLIVAIEMLIDYSVLLGSIVAISLIIMMVALLLTISIKNQSSRINIYCKPGKPGPTIPKENK